MPLAVASGATVHYVHVDHLNTPRLIADATGMAVWRWDQQEPFGVSPPDKNPSGLGVFDFPLRFAGQYDDPETGLFYNYFRDYDPIVGRYIESDPIGLIGGLNTYSYIDGNPLLASDPLGLEWIFRYWITKEHNGWWSHWRWLIAVCYETCTKIMNQQPALYEQWRPTAINAPQVPSYDPFGSAANPVDALVDLGKAANTARKRGSQSARDTTMNDPEAGRKICETLPLPSSAQGKCCPDVE